jgi:hypothetical protein
MADAGTSNGCPYANTESPFDINPLLAQILKGI